MEEEEKDRESAVIFFTESVIEQKRKKGTERKMESAWTEEREKHLSQF